MLRIAIVGSGPTALYTLRHLISSPRPLDITILEMSGSVGTGTPYRRDANHGELLANIASIEIPPILQTLCGWLESRTEDGLKSLGLDRDDIDERRFYPRVVLGAYFRDQFLALAALGARRGHAIDIRCHAEVIDLRLHSTGVEATIRETESDATWTKDFDRVVIATGHAGDGEDFEDGTYHSSPYPTSRLERLQPAQVGILGTSLSAIDAAMTIAYAHGSFAEESGELRYRPNDGSTAIHLIMMSRAGLLPDIDFFVPFPHQPLSALNETSVANAIAEGPKGLLDRLFDLLRRDLETNDPEYAAATKLGELDADTYPQHYFSPREAVDPLAWARETLRTSLADSAAEKTVGWKYTLLRAHEMFELAVPFLDETDRARFDAGFKKLFVDNYAAIPPESIRRLLALGDAGILQVASLGDDYTTSDLGKGAPYQVRSDGFSAQCDILIDATGQRAKGLHDLPFPSLRYARDRHAFWQGAKMSGNGSRSAAPSILMASMPYLLNDRPFVQGIVTCAALGEEIAAAIIESNDAEDPAIAKRDMTKSAEEVVPLA